MSIEDETQKLRVAYLKEQQNRRKGMELIPRKVRVQAKKLLAQGQTQEAVAKQLGISVSTVASYGRRMMKRFRQESELAIKQGLEMVRTTTHENVVASANIVNAHLKAVEKDPERIKNLSSSEAKDYATIAAKEYDKLKSIDTGHKPGENAGVRHNTQVNILQIQREIEATDIVTSATVFDVTPEQEGEEVLALPAPVETASGS